MKLTARHSLQAMLVTGMVLVAASASAASFVYRGSLNDRGEPAEGQYGFRLTFYDAQSGGKALAPPITLDGVSVSRGAFNATLDLDPKLEQRDTLWLAVEVRDASGGFVALDSREAVQPKATAAGICWDTTGNSGNVAGTNFLGNVDLVPLELRANNLPFLRIEPRDDASGYGNVVNIIEGSPANAVSIPGGTALGATIGGGGSSMAAGNSCTQCRNIARGDFSVVSGGLGNSAFGTGDTVAGGSSNSAAEGYSSVGGGTENHALSSGTVPGGFGNCAGGVNSLAAGAFAIVRARTGSNACGFGVPTAPDGNGDEGTFVWSDGASATSEIFASTGPHQFLVQATGGVGLNTNSPGAVSLYVQGFSSQDGTTIFKSPKGSNLSRVHYGTNGDWYIRSAADDGKVVIQDSFGGQVAIGTSDVEFGHLIDTGAFGAYLSNDGVWTDASSRWFKQDFAEVDPGDVLAKVLALPLTTWSYRSSTGHRHLGPMAEDFADAFGLGGDAQHLAPLDADGVALAAIQGLNSKLEADNARLRMELERLATRLDKLEGGAQ